MIKKFLNTAILLLLLTGCDLIDSKVDPGIEFLPRSSNRVWFVSGVQSPNAYYGEFLYDYKALRSDSVVCKDFFLSVFTGNDSLSAKFKRYENRFVVFLQGPTSGLETSNLSLEKEIEKSYLKFINSGRSGFSTKSYDIITPMEYRIDGISKFSISALDKSLFGEKAGTSLNNYFEIFKYEPDFIASNETKTLLYGFGNNDKPSDITEWLNLHPMSAPCIYIRLKQVPEHLPLSVRFKVDIETSDGKASSDTTKVLYLHN